MTTIFVILALSFLIFIHELGHFSAAKWFRVKVLEFGIGFPPRLFGKKRGETEYTINALPFGGFVRILGEDGEGKETSSEHAEEEKDPSRSFVFQSVWKKVVILGAGVFMNFLFGWLAFSAVFMVGIPRHLVISGIQPNSPALQAELKAGDIVLEASAQGEILKDPMSADNFIALTERAKGETMKISILRHGERFEKELLIRENPPVGEGSLGVYLGDAGFDKTQFFPALGEGFLETVNISRLVLAGFGELGARLLTAPRAATENIAGPVGIVMVAKETSALGFVYFLQLLALISVNLAVLNLLPFPALDGGRIILALIERIKGSPVPQKIQLILNAAGFFLLIGLMILVTIQDIRRIF